MKRKSKKEECIKTPGNEGLMKIVFWSNHPKSDVTSNMTAVGVMFSILFPAKVVMMTNHCNYENLGRTLLGNCYEEVLREDHGYFYGRSPRPTIKKIDEVPYRQTLIKDADSLAETGLYYFAQWKKFNNEVYELRVMEELNRFMTYLDETEDYIFIDAKSQNSISTKKLLEEADAVVVNLRQDEQLIRDFFRKYGAITGKSFFFISEYRKKNAYSLKQFITDYSIHPNRVALIPYNPEFSPVTDDGRITEYVMKHHDCTERSKDYHYIRYLKKAAELLKAGLDHQPYLAIETEEIYA